ncbi:MAG TPA: hypothetical protein VFP21_02405 [Solirubrobacterales bacterium]|nr:hypothetical protein [Solirubrobacterales bacterium]
MKKTALCLALLGLLALGGQALAVICAIDEVPAATLLLPYFDVDLSNPNGETTLFSVNNASATAVLAHVVVWSDLSVPVLDFNIYLTGYDVQTVNLRDILVSGIIPRTASAGQDPGDTISPKGQFSQDINFASCTGLLPTPTLPASFVAGLRASLTGVASSNLAGRCAGRAFGDNVARGYITIDTVNSCTLLFPGDPGYFAPGGSGIATNQNVLWGDYFYVNSAASFADGNPLVHIEASATNPETSTSGNYTFYGRYDSPAWNAADNREPLATNFAVRFLNGGVFDGGTDLLVWRDSKTNQKPFTCPAANGNPPWYPLGQEGIVIFDEQEQPQVPQQFPVSPQPTNPSLVPFPAEAQSTHVGGDALPVAPYDFGWLYLNLNTTVPGATGPSDLAAAQAWVTARMTAQGKFSVGFDAAQLDSACTAGTFTVSTSGALHFIP